MSFAGQHAGKHPGDVVELDELQQVLWPRHCIAETHGADFIDDLNVEGIHHVVHKGTDRRIDSYSGFFDNGRARSTGLNDFLKQRGVNRVFIMGLAADYCVKFTALDAVRLGFATYLVKDGCRGVDLNPGDADRAIEEMISAGICVVDSTEIVDKTVPPPH